MSTDETKQENNENQKESLLSYAAKGAEMLSEETVAALKEVMNTNKM